MSLNQRQAGACGDYNLSGTKVDPQPQKHRTSLEHIPFKCILKANRFWYYSIEDQLNLFTAGLLNLLAAPDQFNFPAANQLYLPTLLTGSTSPLPTTRSLLEFSLAGSCSLLKTPLVDILLDSFAGTG